MGPIVNEQGKLSTTVEECLENWKIFYSKLYRKRQCGKKIKTERSKAEKVYVQSKVSEAQEETLDKDITIEEVVEAAFTLRSNTAAGRDSIMSRDILELLDTSIPNENWKNVEMLRFLKNMLQNMWEAEKVPASFKETVLRPFLKDTEMSPTDPSNYRPVSLLNVHMKIYEHIIKERLVRVLEKNKYFSNMQAAYRKRRSTVDHLLVIQEIFYVYRYKKSLGVTTDKQPLYLCLMDLAKAFDTVPRDVLFKKLWGAGIRGKMYRVIKDLYTNNRATIKIGEYVSKSFEIKSGVMQGSKLGPILFNIFINDLLEKLHNSGLGVPMDSITVTALGFADDIILIADKPWKLQALIDICEKWSRQNKVQFNSDKCKVLALNVGLQGQVFHLMGKLLKLVQQAKYLGVILSRSRQTTLYSNHIARVLEKAETRANAIRHLGFHSDGLRPATSIRMYKTLVRPTLEYAAQVLSYKHYYFTVRKSVSVIEPPEMIKKLERFQNRTLKKLVSSPKNTPPAVVRVLTGTMPIAARIDILKLRYFWKLMHLGKDNVAHLLYEEMRKKFLEGAVGYVHEIFNICCKYACMDIWHGRCPRKVNPYARIRRIVEGYHLQEDLEVIRRSTCAYAALRQFKEKKYNIEPRLRGVGRFQSTKHRRVFLYAMLDVSSYDRQCQNCGAHVKDITSHGLQWCPKIKKERKIFELMMKFYDAPKELNTRSKIQVMREALVKKCLLKVVCNFLLIIWKWEE